MRKDKFQEVREVTPTRFERVTHSLEGCCSIQLSYGAGNLYQKQIKKVCEGLRLPLKMFANIIEIVAAPKIVLRNGGF